MTPSLAFEELKLLRDGPMWKLLAAQQAPLVLGLLQHLFPEASNQLGSAALMEKLANELDVLRSHGEDLPAEARSLVAEWVTRC